MMTSNDISGESLIRQRRGEDKDGEWSICSQQGGQRRGFDEFSPSCLLSGVKGQFTRIGQSRVMVGLLAHVAPKKKEITGQGFSVGVQNNIELLRLGIICL